MQLRHAGTAVLNERVVACAVLQAAATTALCSPVGSGCKASEMERRRGRAVASRFSECVYCSVVVVVVVVVVITAERAAQALRLQQQDGAGVHWCC